MPILADQRRTKAKPKEGSLIYLSPSSLINSQICTLVKNNLKAVYCLENVLRIRLTFQTFDKHEAKYSNSGEPNYKIDKTDERDLLTRGDLEELKERFGI